MRIYRNTGGTTWRESATIHLDRGGGPTDLSFSSPKTIWGTTPVGLVRSNDGGFTWEDLTENLPFIEPNGYSGGLFMNDSTGWIIRSFLFGPGSTSFIETTDGGATWQGVPENCNVGRRLTSATLAVRAGVAEAFCRNNDGRILRQLKDPSENQSVGEHLISYTASGRRGWFVGSRNGQPVISTGLSGEPFEELSLPAIDGNAELWSISVRPNHAAIACGSRNERPFCMHSADGLSWVTSEEIADAPPLTVATGVAFGAAGVAWASVIETSPAIPRGGIVLLRSEDGGATWSIERPFPDDQGRRRLHDIATW